MNVFERAKFRLRIKAPVHIGCGEAYDPLSFIVDENKGRLLIVDQDMLIKSLPDKLREEFSRICLSGDSKSILAIYKFMRRLGERKDIIEKPGVVVRKISVVPGFIDHYRKVLKGDPRKNTRRDITQFVVQRTAYEPNSGFRPFIPGSSLKGALRTAVLNMWKDNARRKHGYRNSRDLEEDILGGSFSNDPFSLVKVSDFIARNGVKTGIFYAVNVRKQQHGSTASQSSIFDIFEAIYEGEFEGEITVFQPPAASTKIRRIIKQPLTIDDLLQATKLFYFGELKREYALLKNMQNKITMSWKTSFLGKPVIRIGRHSGAECVTIEGFRQIGIRNRRESYDHATTIWLASNYKTPRGCAPFGWCELEKIKN